MKQWCLVSLVLAMVFILGCAAVNPTPTPTPKWKCADVVVPGAPGSSKSCVQDDQLGTYLSLADCQKVCSSTPIPSVKPSGNPPLFPAWAGPKPQNISEYLSWIDLSYPEWGVWFKIHPEDIPNPYLGVKPPKGGVFKFVR